MPREIIVTWTTPSGGGKKSVLMFAEGNLVSTQRNALFNFLANVDGGLDNSISWFIEPTGREMDSTTGALTGAWSDSTSYAGTGGVTGEPAADATQVLFQWHTEEIVNGRFLRGRTNIPGLAAANLVGGNLGASIQSTYQGYADALIAAAVGLGVWHRPTSGSGGVFHDANSASVWSELSVLRRRRG